MFPEIFDSGIARFEGFVLYVFLSYAAAYDKSKSQTLNLPVLNPAGCQWQDTLSWIICWLSVHSLHRRCQVTLARRDDIVSSKHVRRFQLKASAVYSAGRSIQEIHGSAPKNC